MCKLELARARYALTTEGYIDRTLNQSRFTSVTDAAHFLVSIKKKPQRSLRLSKSHTQASAARREIIIRNLINVGTIPYILLARLACQSCYHETPQQ